MSTELRILILGWRVLCSDTPKSLGLARFEPLRESLAVELADQLKVVHWRVPGLLAPGLFLWVKGDCQLVKVILEGHLDLEPCRQRCVVNHTLQPADLIELYLAPLPEGSEKSTDELPDTKRETPRPPEGH